MAKGVYQIRCKKNGFRYIGGSRRSIENRFSYHLAELSHNQHYNIALQQDWNKYGATAFVFEVVITCEGPEVIKQEQLLLNRWFDGKCYNRYPDAESGKGSKRTPEQRKRIAAAAVARCTSKWRKAVSKRVKRQHAEGRLGQPTWSEEVKRKTYQKIGESWKRYLQTHSHPRKGKKATPEQRERYRQAAIKREAKRRKERECTLSKQPA